MRRHPLWVLATITGLLAATLGVAAGPASAGTIGVIALVNAPVGTGYAGVKDNVNTAGQPVWTINSGGNGLYWVETGTSVHQFEDANDHSLCLGEDNFAVVLRTCGNATTYWVVADNARGGFDVINDYRSEGATTYVLSAPSDQRYHPLTLKPLGQTGQWQSWTVPVV